jgi:hypothetical protein
LESTVKIGGHDKISNGQSFADEIGLMKQDSIKVLHDTLDLNLSGLNRLFIVVIRSKGRTEPVAKTRENFMVCKGAPLDYFGVGFGLGRNKCCVRILLGNCPAQLEFGMEPKGQSKNA